MEKKKGASDKEMNQKKGDCENGSSLEALVSIDERGQLVLPKDIREKAGIKAGDKFAVLSWCEKGKICCISLVKADDMSQMMKNFMQPMMNDIFGGTK